MRFFRELWTCNRKSYNTEDSTGSTEVVYNQSDIRVSMARQIASLAVTEGSCMMDASELLYLASAAQVANLANEDIVVEIGAYVGTTTVFIHRVLELLGNHVTPILSIDPFERVSPDKLNPQGVFRRYMKNIRAAAGEKRCVPLIGFSHEVYKVVSDRIGLLIVDGDHKYESAASDLTLYASKVRPGGIVFVDDYNAEFYPGVVRAFEDFICNRTDFRLLHQSWFAMAQRI